jgi:hypothetical protein
VKTNDENFKELQKDWYQKLKDTGFEDIETLTSNGFRLKQEHRRFFRSRGDRDRDMWQTVFIEAKTNYYLRLTHKVNDPETEFRSDLDRIIMTLHSEGFSKVQIVQFLEAFGYKRKRKAIIYLIRRYEHKWGLKTYTQKQLNRKPKKPQAMI